MALAVIGATLGRDQQREVEDLRRRSSQVPESEATSGSSREGETRDPDRTQEMRGGEDDEDEVRDRERLASLRGHLTDFPD